MCARLLFVGQLQPEIWLDQTGPHRDDVTHVIFISSWHLSTQLRSEERTGRRLLWSTTLLLPTLLSDSQVLISLVIHGLWWTVSGQVKANVVLTCTKGSRPITFLWLWQATDHKPHCWHVPINKNLKVDWIYSMKRVMTQSYDWNLQRLQHLWNNNNRIRIQGNRSIVPSAKVNIRQFITSLTGTLCNAVFATWSYA